MFKRLNTMASAMRLGQLTARDTIDSIPCEELS